MGLAHLPPELLNIILKELHNEHGRNVVTLSQTSRFFRDLAIPYLNMFIEVGPSSKQNANRPSHSILKHVRNVIVEGEVDNSEENSWGPLVSLIKQLPHLSKFVFRCSSHIPRIIYDAFPSHCELHVMSLDTGAENNDFNSRVSSTVNLFCSQIIKLRALEHGLYDLIYLERVSKELQCMGQLGSLENLMIHIPIHCADEIDTLWSQCTDFFKLKVLSLCLGTFSRPIWSSLLEIDWPNFEELHIVGIIPEDIGSLRSFLQGLPVRNLTIENWTNENGLKFVTHRLQELDLTGNPDGEGAMKQDHLREIAQCCPKLRSLAIALKYSETINGSRSLQVLGRLPWLIFIRLSLIVHDTYHPGPLPFENELEDRIDFIQNHLEKCVLDQEHPKSMLKEIKDTDTNRFEPLLELSVNIRAKLTLEFPGGYSSASGVLNPPWICRGRAEDTCVEIKVTKMLKIGKAACVTSLSEYIQYINAGISGF